MSADKYVDCPKCGGNPEVDSEGCYYTCFYCCNERIVLASSIEPEPTPARVLKHRHSFHFDGYSDGGTHVYTVKSKDRPTLDELAMAGIHEMSCHCGHDCCGHAFSRGPEIVRRNKRHEWFVVLHYAYNV